MTRALLLLCAASAVAAAERKVAGRSDGQLSKLEEEHARPFWRLGDGFEGSASDYTEYFVWVIGVIAVFYYMLNEKARRNPYDDSQWQDPDQPAQAPFGPGDESFQNCDGSKKED
jgi:hypothetical protein